MFYCQLTSYNISIVPSAKQKKIETSTSEILFTSVCSVTRSEIY